MKCFFLLNLKKEAEPPEHSTALKIRTFRKTQKKNILFLFTETF